MVARWLNGRPADDGRLAELTAALAAREAELEAARREAEDALATRREFIAAMNHELRTPLNAILGFGQLLEMSRLDDQQRDNLRQVLKGGRHLLQLVNELLEVSQLDAGSLDLSPEPVNLAELLEEVRDLVQPMTSERAIALEVPLPDPALRVRADRHRFKQVLLNLLSNAIKFNQERGRVAVRVSTRASGLVRVAVTDTGPGLTAAQIARLFAPFERLDASHAGIEGTGLGLTLCRGLMNRMDGAIGVDSARGEGATFWVELPATEDVAPPTAVSGRPATPNWAAGDRSSRLVLHIDDNSTNLRLIEQVLACRPGTSLMAAMQGRLGLELAREHQPALILLDLNLPDTHGLDVLRRLAGDPRTAAIPVVVVTADATPGMARRAHALGARALLAKPLDVAELLAVLDDVAPFGEETACPRT